MVILLIPRSHSSKDLNILTTFSIVCFALPSLQIRHLEGGTRPIVLFIVPKSSSSGDRIES